jgi:site-specific recombinase XerD
VALSEVIANGIHKYLAEFKPVTWLFNAHTKGKQYSTRSIQSVMQQAIAKAAIDKDASVHALRHSYATHLLEDGVNIVTVQALMGHAKLETTMIYLQLLSKNTQAVKSPLDTLYNL